MIIYHDDNDIIEEAPTFFSPALLCVMLAIERFYYGSVDNRTRSISGILSDICVLVTQHCCCIYGRSCCISFDLYVLPTFIVCFKSLN